MSHVAHDTRCKQLSSTGTRCPNEAADVSGFCSEHTLMRSHSSSLPRCGAVRRDGSACYAIGQNRYGGRCCMHAEGSSAHERLGRLVAENAQLKRRIYALEEALAKARRGAELVVLREPKTGEPMEAR